MALMTMPAAINKQRLSSFTFGQHMGQTLDAFLEAVQKNPPDIAMCEAQGATEELCATIQHGLTTINIHKKRKA